MSRLSEGNLSHRRTPNRALDQAALDSTQEVESSKAVPRKRRPSILLMTYENIPSFMRDNPFILGGYRARFSWSQCLKSMFRLHNETLNVWTHFIGALIFFGLLIHTVNVLSPHGVDRIIGMGDLGGDSFKSSFQNLVRSARSHIPTVSGVSEAIKHQADSLRENFKGGRETISGIQAQFLHYADSVDHSLKTLAHGVSEKVCPKCSIKSIGVMVDSLEANLLRLAHVLEDAKDEVVIQSKEKVKQLIHFIQNMERNFDLMKSIQDPLRYLTRFPLGLFIVSASVCMFFSACYHLFFCHSEHIYGIFMKLDYAGICFLIGGTASAAAYYCFYCFTELRVLYSTITAVAPAIAFLMTLSETMMTPKCQPIRAAVFVLTGSSAGIFLLHFVHIHGEAPSFVWNIVLGGALYILGAVIFASRVPERWFPGKFDIWFHSHTLFHIFVILGALVHYLSLRQLYEWRITHGCKEFSPELPGF